MEKVDGKTVVQRIKEHSVLMINGSAVDTAYIKCTHDHAQVKYEGYFLYAIDQSEVSIVESETLLYEDGTSCLVTDEKPLTEIAKDLDSNTVFEVRAVNGDVTTKTTVYD